jgi:membrane protein implicated in regulation of membrane protease activity
MIAIGSVAAIAMAPLAFVPTGPFRLDRIGVLAASFAFAWCGWRLLRHPAAARSESAP